MKHVAILHGDIPADAPPDEQDTLVQVKAVAEALVALGYQTRAVPVGLNLELLRTELERSRPDVVVNLVETLGGAMRLTPAAPLLVEALGLPYTGCSAAALLVTTDKCYSKAIFRRAGLSTPRWLDPRSQGLCSLEFSSPTQVIIKSIHEDGSIGLTDNSVIKVKQKSDLLSLLASRRKTAGGEWFAEEFVDGREFNLGLLEQGGKPRVLPIAEIEFKDYPASKPRIVGYAAKWDDDSFEAQHTVHRTEFAGADLALIQKLSDTALRIWDLLELSGYARVDFRVSADGEPLVIEVNANPCISPDAGFTKAAARARISYPEMIGHIMEAARVH